MSLHYPPRRNFGRRKRDRFVGAVGLGLGFALSALVISANQCGKTSDSTGPSPIASSQPAVASSTPAPAPTATPTAVGEPTNGFELWGITPSTLNLKYTGSASFVKVDTWYTSFDNQDLPFGKQSHTIKTGDTLVRVFDQRCIQADADQPGVKLIGGIFFDKNGNPFIPSQHPEKVAECRACDPKNSHWTELEKREIGEWEDYTPDVSPESQVEKCFKWQRQLITIFEQNDCSKEKRKLRSFYETRQVEIACPCQKYSQLVLVADPDDPNHGQSFFEYHVFRTVGSEDVLPGIGLNKDVEIYHANLAKNQKVVLAQPEDGSGFYAFYDSEIAHRVRTVATCPVGVTAAWSPKLGFECGCK